MGKSGIYRVKVKNGNNFVEIQGDKKFTEDMFHQISEIFPKAGKKPVTKKRGRQPKPKPKIDLKNMSIEELVEKIKDKRSSSRVLVSGYILNKILKKREFRSKEMVNFMEEHGITVPKNPTYHFRKLKESGSFIQGRKGGRFKISDNGIKEIPKLL